MKEMLRAVSVMGRCISVFNMGNYVSNNFAIVQLHVHLQSIQYIHKLQNNGDIFPRGLSQ